MPERLLADRLVLPRRELLEHVELGGDELEAQVGAAQQAGRSPEVAAPDEPRRLLDLVPGELEPELRGLVHGLEQKLVAVHPLVGGLLEREQLVGAQIALVVAPRVTGENRLLEVFDLLHGDRVGAYFPR